MLIETAAIRTVWGAAWHFLKSIPREAWYIAAAALLLWWIDGRAYDRGRASRDADIAALEKQLQSSNASVAALEGALTRYVEEGALRAEQAQEALERATGEGGPMREAARDTARTDWRGQEGL